MFSKLGKKHGKGAKNGQRRKKGVDLFRKKEEEIRGKRVDIEIS